MYMYLYMYTHRELIIWIDTQMDRNARRGAPRAVSAAEVGPASAKGRRGSRRTIISPSHRGGMLKGVPTVKSPKSHI